ncbi:hypothetical protein DFH28DRAFT_879208, partial [Melampsora americana]
AKAQGNIVQYIPLTMYSDDTLGSHSKRFNKHTCYYFTYLGLPTRLANLEYNIHWLAASTKANALELGKNIVDQLNYLSQEGYHAYDSGLQQDVLVMAVQLAHLGDSPMHAEISNTRNPGTSLNLFRICCLGVDSKALKKEEQFVRGFVGINLEGDMVLLFLFKNNYHCLTNFAAPLAHKLAMEYEHKYGERIYNLYFRLDGESQTRWSSSTGSKSLGSPCIIYSQVLMATKISYRAPTCCIIRVVRYLYLDALQKIPRTQIPTLAVRWKAFNVSGLHIQQMQHSRLVHSFLSLTGKEFCIVVQGAPFVLHEWLSFEERGVWTHLSHMTSIIYNPEIRNMDQYCCKLDRHINNFLCSIISLNARWVNKPKLHMLTHLTPTIRRLGPAVLYMTESFKSTNILTRTALLHSSRHDPGAQLAESFQNVEVTSHLFSGGLVWNEVTKNWVNSGRCLQEIVENEDAVENIFGFKLHNWHSILNSNANSMYYQPGLTSGQELNVLGSTYYGTNIK